jgi:hypothetical protein
MQHIILTASPAVLQANMPTGVLQEKYSYPANKCVLVCIVLTVCPPPVIVVAALQVVKVDLAKQVGG